MAHEDAEGPAALLLTATVARRYYVDGANKSEIAAELDLSRVGETFWVYAAFNLAAFVFVYLRMPEFTGRSLEQIEGSLRKGHFRPQNFERRTVAEEVPA